MVFQRDLGRLSGEEEEVLLCELDELWEQLTEAERAEVDQRANARIQAESTLHLIDLPQKVGTLAVPREAA